MACTFSRSSRSRSALPPVVALVFLLCTWFLSLSARQEPITAADHPVDGAVALSLRIPASITLREPVIAEFVAFNNTDRAVSIDMGDDLIGSFTIGLMLPDGSAAPRRPAVTRSLTEIADIRIKPHREYSQRVLLNHWYEFPTTGTYGISVRFEGAISSGEEPVPVSDRQLHARLIVLPPSDAILSSTCRDLARAALGPETLDTRFEVGALGAVTSPIAIPFLAEVAAAGRSPEIAIPALAKTGTADARAALELLSLNPDNDVAQLARGALNRLIRR